MSDRAVLLNEPSNKKGERSLTNNMGENPSQFSLDSPMTHILFLQQAVGNQAVQRLIKPGTLQAKLKCGQHNDKYEQEADRLAEEVMRVPESACTASTPEKQDIQSSPLTRAESSTFDNPLDDRDIINPMQGESLFDLQCCTAFDVFSFDQDVTFMSDEELIAQYQAVQDFYGLYGTSHFNWPNAVSYEMRLLEEANNRLIILEPYGGRYWLQYAECLAEQIESGETNIVISGADSFRNGIRSLLRQLMTESLSGYLLILELVHGEHPLIIEEAWGDQETGTTPMSSQGRLQVWSQPDEEEAEPQALPVEEQRPGSGTGSEIAINLNYFSNAVTVGRDASGNLTIIEMGPLIALAHELIHALHNQQGINLASGNTVLGNLYPVRNPITNENANPEELFTIRGQRQFESPRDLDTQAVYWATQFNLPYRLFSVDENEIRSQLGMPERVSHRGALRSMIGNYNARDTVLRLINRFYSRRDGPLNSRARIIIGDMIGQLNPQVYPTIVFSRPGQLSLPTPEYIDLYYRYVLDQTAIADYFRDVTLSGTIESTETQDSPDTTEQQAVPAPTCVVGPGIQAPNESTLTSRLEAYGILQPTGRSTDFANILYRHVRDRTETGEQYLNYLRTWAYPMGNFCIPYRGNGWNNLFRDVQRYYYWVTPRHRSMRLVQRAVTDYARSNLFVYEEEAISPGGQRDPFASIVTMALTASSIRRVSRDSLLGGRAPESLLLLLATDDYLTSLTLPEAAVTSAQIEPVTSGTTPAEDVFQWGTPGTEDSQGDPNRFDDLIVYWVNHYNNIFLPLDREGNPNPLNPDLVKAIIWAESRFSETAGSPRRAFGLMQMTTGARREVTEMTAGVSGFTNESYQANPGIQIATGIRILFEKYRRSRDWRTAVRDYNGSARREAYARNVWARYSSHGRQ